jgi:hypothetical protein
MRGCFRFTQVYGTDGCWEFKWSDVVESSDTVILVLGQVQISWRKRVGVYGRYWFLFHGTVFLLSIMLLTVTELACGLGGRLEDLSTWSYGTTTTKTRQERNVDSGLRVLADVEACYLGQLHAAENVDVDMHRLIVRKAILSLPGTTEEHAGCPAMPASTYFIKWRKAVEQIIVAMFHRPEGAYIVPATVKQSHSNSLQLEDAPISYSVMMRRLIFLHLNPPITCIHLYLYPLPTCILRFLPQLCIPLWPPPTCAHPWT